MLTQDYDNYEYQDDYSQYPENLDYHYNDYGNPGLKADNFYDYLGQTNNQFPDSNTDSFYEDPFIVNQKRPPTQAPTRPPTTTTTKRSRWSKKKRKWTPFNNHLFGRKKRSVTRHSNVCCFIKPNTKFIKSNQFLSLLHPCGIKVASSI